MYLVELWRARQILAHLWIAVFVVDEIAHSDKFLCSVRASEEDNGHSYSVVFWYSGHIRGICLM